MLKVKKSWHHLLYADVRSFFLTRKCQKIFWTTWVTSMKFSEKMWLMIILKVKKQVFTISLEETLFEKPQGGVQTDTPLHHPRPSCFRVEIWLWIIVFLLIAVLYFKQFIDGCYLDGCLLTLNKSKEIDSRFAEFGQVKMISSVLAHKKFLLSIHAFL